MINIIEAIKTRCLSAENDESPLNANINAIRLMIEIEQSIAEACNIVHTIRCLFSACFLTTDKPVRGAYNPLIL